MLIAATKLEHLPVIDPDSHHRLGTIQAVVFDPDTGKFVALQIKKSGLLREKRYVAAIDIQSFENHAVLCADECLVPLSDLPRVEATVTAHRPLLYQRAQTTTKKPLGKVAEIMFDHSSQAIVQLHTHLLFTGRIFPFDQVVRVTKKYVIFKDDQAFVSDTEVRPAELTAV